MIQDVPQGDRLEPKIAVAIDPSTDVDTNRRLVEATVASTQRNMPAKANDFEPITKDFQAYGD